MDTVAYKEEKFCIDAEKVKKKIELSLLQDKSQGS
jgi:hypothetical protein